MSEIEMTNDESLKFTQSIRVSVVNTMVKNGTVPTDSDSVKLLMAVMRDMDDQALKLLRIEADNNNAAADRDLAKLLEMAQHEAALRGLSGDKGQIPAKRDPRSLDTDFLPEPTLVKGQLDIAPDAEDYNSFVGRMEERGD